MRAQAGDLIRIPSRSGPAQAGEIMAVCGRERGAPPFVVRFASGRVALVVPGSDAVIEHRPLSELPG